MTVADLEARFGHVFSDRELLEESLTHRSSRHEQGGTDNERLELLGDAVVGLATVEWLMKRFPDRSEGELSRLKNRLVSAKNLAQWARDLDLGAELRLGEGEHRSGGRDKRSVLADGLEALLGAVFLDAGFAAASSIVATRLDSIEVDAGVTLPLVEAKNRLQEFVQASGVELPRYRLLEESGPPHERRFRVEVRVGDEVLGTGWGSSKKAAEQIAAREALMALGVIAGPSAAAKIRAP